MELIRIKQHELIQVADDMAAAPGTGIAITPWRARGQALNPVAAKDDILLLYVKDASGNVCGFAGILPGLLNGRPDQKIFWNSCWYADPRYGGQVSVPLLMEFLRITNRRVLFSDLSHQTMLIIQSLGGFIIRKRQGVLVRLRSSMHERAVNIRKTSLPGRMVNIMAVTGLFRLYDLMLNLSVKKRHRAFIQASTDWSTLESDFPSDSQIKFIQEHSHHDITRPDKSQIEWWMDSHWLTQDKNEYKALRPHYFFSIYASDFRYSWLEIRKSDTRAGIALLTYRDGTVKTSYLWYTHEFEEEFFSELYRFILRNDNYKVIVSFHEAFVRFIKANPKMYRTSLEKIRYTAIDEQIAKISGKDFVMQDGDGDYLFT